jgi:hypothetical protein
LSGVEKVVGVSSSRANFRAAVTMRIDQFAASC